jgi:Arc/MetJ family transcription regulator
MSLIGQPKRSLITMEVDDDLMAAAMIATGLPTEQATVEEALRRLVRRRRQMQAVAEMTWPDWDGDLDEMRMGCSFDKELSSH